MNEPKEEGRCGGGVEGRSTPGVGRLCVVQAKSGV